MKICPKCSSILADNEPYCENCGYDPDFDDGQYDYDVDNGNDYDLDGSYDDNYADYDNYDNIITPSTTSSTYYMEQGRYDLVPISVSVKGSGVSPSFL